jgi:beta-phosphoglucomutase-like phosphatase (HAD superfamily)
VDARRGGAIRPPPTGVAAAAAAGMYVIGVPYFTGAQLPGCDLLAGSLADPAVGRALGLGS